MFDGPLAGQSLTGIIVTHYHTDHVGLAGWLAARFGVPLFMRRPEYLYSLALQHAPGNLGTEMHRPLYRRRGLPSDLTNLILSRGREYLPRTTSVPSKSSPAAAMFCGLRVRIDELIAHHGQRCAENAVACHDQPLSVAEALPHVFRRELDVHQTGFAFGEVLAHVNHMLARGQLVPATDPDGTDHYRTAPDGGSADISGEH